MIINNNSRSNVKFGDFSLYTKPLKKYQHEAVSNLPKYHSDIKNLEITIKSKEDIISVKCENWMNSKLIQVVKNTLGIDD